MNKQKMNDHRMSDDEYEADQKAADEWAVEHASRMKDLKEQVYSGLSDFKAADLIQVFSATLEGLDYSRISKCEINFLNYELVGLYLKMTILCPSIKKQVNSHVDVICGDAVTTEMENDQERGHE